MTLEPMPLPDDYIEWLRLANALLGIIAFGLLIYRLVGRWRLTSWLARCVVSLLAGAVFVLGAGAARAAQLGAEFNELAWAALAVNVGTVLVGVLWHRLIDHTGRRR